VGRFDIWTDGRAVVFAGSGTEMRIWAKTGEGIDECRDEGALDVFGIGQLPMKADKPGWPVRLRFAGILLIPFDVELHFEWHETCTLTSQPKCNSRFIGQQN